jgi:hypothetical protein
MKRSVYRVAVGDDVDRPQLIYLVAADNPERAAALAAERSDHALAWPLGEERPDVTMEEGVIAMSEAS